MLSNLTLNLSEDRFILHFIEFNSKLSSNYKTKPGTNNIFYIVKVKS